MSHLTTVAAASLQSLVSPCARLARAAKGTYRSVGLDGSVQLHRRATLLDNLGILAVQTAFLVFLHPRNFLLQPNHENFNPRRHTLGGKMGRTASSCACPSLRHRLEREHQQ